MALLLTMGGARALLQTAPPGTENYHQRIAAAADALPRQFDSWVSQDSPVPVAAIAMLHPNVILCRKFINNTTGQQATLLLVQCRDARDLLGHYPPVCYKSSGYTPVSSSPKDWQVDDLRLQGMLYEFSSTRPEQMNALLVCNFMLLPSGQTCRDMDGVYATARDPRKRFLGAAQVQVLVNPGLSETERDAIVQTLVHANRSVIDAILSGGT